MKQSEHTIEQWRRKARRRIEEISKQYIRFAFIYA